MTQKTEMLMSPNLEMQLVKALDVLLPELDAVIILDQVEEAVGGVLSPAIRDAAIERARTLSGSCLLGG